MTTYRVIHDRHFTQVHNETIRDSRLSFRARGVLVWLLSHVDTWEVSREQIARNGKEGVDAIRTAEAELKALGYLERVQERTAEGKVFYVTNVYEIPGETVGGLSTNGSTTNGSTTNGESNDIEEHPSEDYCEEEHQPLVVASQTTIEFDEWYSQWPKKEGKHVAEKKWKKLSDDERRLCIEALPLWADYVLRHPSGKQYVPMASTYLNQRKWEDDMPVLPNSAPAPSRAMQTLMNPDLQANLRRVLGEDQPQRKELA